MFLIVLAIESIFSISPNNPLFFILLDTIQIKIILWDILINSQAHYSICFSLIYFIISCSDFILSKTSPWTILESDLTTSLVENVFNLDITSKLGGSI